MKRYALGIVIVVFLCLVFILPSLADQIVLPSGTTVVEDGAFFGDQSLTELVLQEGLLRIGSKAFASTSLNSVVLPRSIQYFASDAFDFGDEDFEFYVYKDSDAAKLCVEYGLQPKTIDYTPSSFTFITGGTAGTYFAYGTVLAYYISNNSDVSITAVAGTGSADNIDALDINDAQLGIVQNDIAYYALNGIRFERFENNPMTSFTALAALYTETIQLVTCNPDIKSVSDLRGKKVSLGSVGSGVYFTALDFLAAYGMTEADINPQYLSFGDSAEALKDGKIDAAFVVASVPTPAVTDLFTHKNSYLVPLDAAHIRALQEISPVYTESIIPAGTYANQSEDVVAVGLKATIIANGQVSNVQAYTIVKTIFEGKNAIAGMHAKGAQLNLEYASSCGLPYHDGATRYYAEHGIEVNMNH